MAFDLSSLRRGKSGAPPRIVIYSEHGLGKSTFAASAPAPVFICTEDGLGNIDATSFPLCGSYRDVLQCVGSLYEESHDFQTVCLDSLDWLESLVWKHVAKKHDKAEIEDFGYGKGYVYAADEFRQVLAGLNALRLERGMTVILTAHCKVKRFDDPAADASYDRYRMKLHDKAAAIVQEWADVVLFATEEFFTRAEDVGFDKKVTRAKATGQRVLHTTHTPAYDAKNRYGLPPTLPLSWAAFDKAMTEGAN